MRKFTVFTIILTVIIIVVVSEIAVKKYLPSLKKPDSEDGLTFTLPTSLDLSKSIETNVSGSDTSGLNNRLGSDIDPSGLYEAPIEDISLESDSIFGPELLSEEEIKIDDTEIFDTEIKEITAQTEDHFPDTNTDPALIDFEDENFISHSVNVYLREEQIRSAGFNDAYLESEPHSGLLFKNIVIDDLPVVEMDKTLIRTKDTLLAKVYIIRVTMDGNINEIYQLLKMRAAQGFNVEINETNTFGLASYYTNDPNRADTAFLTVRIGGLIYAFSYPKEYHAQISNLIQLLEWELGT